MPIQTLTGHAIRVTASLFAFVLMLTVAIPLSASERRERSINVGGMQRNYIVHLPDFLGNQESWPVLVGFHPGVASAKDFERISNLHRAPGANRFVVVYPDGFRRSWNVEECCGAAMQQRIDDLGFYRAMMADLKNFANVRPRAYLTGFSNGAKMTYYVMCKLPDMVAAVAPVGGSITLNNSCRTSHPIPMLHIHGEYDEYAPLNGGMSERQKAGMQPSIPENVKYFASRNSCGQKTVSTLVADVRCQNWTSCSNGADVSLCVVPKLGHLWPGGSLGLLGAAMGLGPARSDIPASTAIVNFFLNNM